MATAEELLASSAGDVDKTLIISNDLRTIKIPASVPNLGVESDDEVLRLHFKMPRYIGDIDLSTFSIRINYLNANGKGDVYTVNDAATTDDTITFSWLVGPTATEFKGDTHFNVCMKIVNDEGFIEREYNTTPASLTVLEGLETDERVITMYSDILEQWKRELFGFGDTEEARIKELSQQQQAAITTKGQAAVTAIETHRKQSITSIESKGEEVLASIPEDYTTTYNMANDALRTRANAIVVTLEGETIAANDCSSDYIRGLKLFGKTKQTVTTGKNLLDCSTPNVIETSEGERVYECKYNSNGDLLCLTVDGTGSQITFHRYTVVLGAGTYILTGCPTGGNANRYCQMLVNPTTLARIGYDVGDGLTFTLSEETTLELFTGRVFTGVLVERLEFYPMIRLADTEDDIFEPYSAGLVSPNPGYPQALENAGASGSIEVVISSSDSSVPIQTLTANTPNGLPSIAVDSDGQRWICDEIDFARGVHVHRVATKVLDGTENWVKSDEGMYYAVDWTDVSGSEYPEYAISSHYINDYEKACAGDEGYFGIDANGRVCVTSSLGTVEEFKEWLSNRNVVVSAARQTPIEIALTDEEIFNYSQLRSNYLNTTVSNDAGVHMSFTYNADTQAYFNNSRGASDEQVANSVDVWLTQHFTSAEEVSF